jgi:hypothetical protein
MIITSFSAELDGFELSPTSEELDGIRIVAKNSSGDIITVPINVCLLKSVQVIVLQKLILAHYSARDTYLPHE